MTKKKPKPIEVREEVVEFGVSEPQSRVLASRSSIIADIAGQGGGKTVNIGISVGWLVEQFPEAKGFIGANTHMQLSDSTLSRVWHDLEKYYGLTEYDKETNPNGDYIVGMKPPRHWPKTQYKFKNYHNILSFKTGARVFLGSLDNYKAHDGKEFAWAHLDETKDTVKQAITDVLLGRLRQVGMWITPDGDVIWAPLISNEVAERQGLKAWNPLYIHTSPAEGSVEWLIELLGIAPYEKEIRDRITKKDDYFFKELVVKDEESGLEVETTIVIYSAHWNEDNLPPNYIAGKKSRMSKSEQLKFIYGYPFGRNGGEFFPGFDRFKHVGQCPYQRGKSIHTAWDFNAAPYVTLLCCHVEYVKRWWCPLEKKKHNDWKAGYEAIEVLRITVFREFTLAEPLGGTEKTADAFADAYELDQPDVFVNGDASGLARMVGLQSLTQYKIIANRWNNRIFLAEGYLRTKKTNIAISKRRDFMNRVWEGAEHRVEVVIDESCKFTIRDCEYLLLDPKTGGKYKEEEKDANGIKIQKLGHCADALEYLVCDLCRDFIKEM